MLIDARIEPEALAESIEAELVATVCATKRRLERSTDHTPSPTQPRINKTNRTNRKKPTMTTITRSITIDAPSTEVWAALADFGNIAVFNPAVKQSKLTSDQPNGLGATRECVLAPVGVVQERITSWEEGRLMSIEIYDRKMIPGLRTAVATIELDPRGEQTGVSVTIDYAVGLGVLGASMNAVAMRGRFRKALSGMVAGLKHHVETGEAVTAKTKIPVNAVSSAA